MNIEIEMIVIWYGSSGTIPDGYLLCDGNNETPDMADRLPFCGDFIEPAGPVAGSWSHFHVGSTLKHTHEFNGGPDVGVGEDYSYETNEAEPVVQLQANNTTLMCVGLHYLRRDNLINPAASNVTPRGIIILWHGPLETIPPGWIWCDGQNGTPWFKSYFVPGAGTTFEQGELEGSRYHKHEIWSGSHSHTVKIGETVEAGAVYGSPTGLATMDGYTKLESNYPPYHALVYIMKT